MYKKLHQDATTNPKLNFNSEVPRLATFHANKIKGRKSADNIMLACDLLINWKACKAPGFQYLSAGLGHLQEVDES